MKKKILVVLSIVMIMMMMSFVSFAADVTNPIKVQLDGKYVDFKDSDGNVVNPEIMNDRTMVPMRKIFEILEADVNWDNATRTVVAKTKEKEITLTIDNKIASLKNLLTNETKQITLDAAPVILNDRTMVPVRFIAESLEKNVGWDSEYRTVIIIDFDKIEKMLEEEVPVLKKLSEIEVDPVTSLKAEATVNGKLTYTDTTDKTNNESISVDGTYNINVNQDGEIEMGTNLSLNGKGQIFDAVAQAGMEKISLKLILADGEAYVMNTVNGKEEWQRIDAAKISGEVNIKEILKGNFSKDEIINVIKENAGELKIETYSSICALIKQLGIILNENSVKISGTGSTKTVTFTFDYADIVKRMSDVNISGMPETIDAKLVIVEKIANKKITTMKLNLDAKIQDESKKETIDFGFEVDGKITGVNSSFDIKAPNVM